MLWPTFEMFMFILYLVINFDLVSPFTHIASYAGGHLEHPYQDVVAF